MYLTNCNRCANRDCDSKKAKGLAYRPDELCPNRIIPRFKRLLIEAVLEHPQGLHDCLRIAKLKIPSYKVIYANA